MRAGVAQGGILSPVLFSLYVNNMPSPSRYVELAVYVEDTAVMATYSQPELLVSYLETYFSYLVRWLRELRIAINVSKSTAMLFAKAGRSIPKLRPVWLFGEPIQWVDTSRYLRVTFTMRLTWSTHIDQMRNKAAQRLGVLGSCLFVRNGVLLYKKHIRPLIGYACLTWRSSVSSHIRKMQVLRSKCLRIATNAP